MKKLVMGPKDDRGSVCAENDGDFTSLRESEKIDLLELLWKYEQVVGNVTK